MSALGDYLLWLRMRAGLSRPELAALSGVARSTVLRVEQGQEPSARLLAAWLAATGASADEKIDALGRARWEVTNAVPRT